MSLLNELKRRNVIRVGTAYVVMAWLIIQVVETLFPVYGLEDGAIRLVVTLLAIGLIPVVILAWAFELTPEGLKKDADVDRSQPASLKAGKRLDRMIMVALALALGYFAFDKFVLDPSRDQSKIEIARQEGRSAALNEPYGDKSIAVLPFTNLSADSSNQFFADGIHDDLLTRISNIQDIKTISRSSVMSYRNSSKSLRSIADELSVSTILEGGVQRAGDQVKINLQLIDAESDASLWAQTYTRELTATNVFVVQAEITEAVAGALKVFLSADEQGQVEKQPTANLQALDAYYLGNQLFSQKTSDSVGRAIRAYQEAILLDPEFALAYSKQASAVLQQTWISGLPLKTQLEESRPLIDQAILLDPQSSEAFNALGIWYQYSGETERAVQAFEQAMTLGPNNVSALAGYGGLIQYGMWDPASAIKLYRKAIELDPRNIGLKTDLARAMPEEEGIRMLEDIVVEHPDYAMAYRDLAALYSDWEFRHDKAIRVSRRAYELDPMHPSNSVIISNTYWRLGDYVNAALWLNHIARLVPNPEEARVYRGWAFISHRDFESAREEFDRSKSRSGIYWLGAIYLANIDTAEGRPDEAIARLNDYTTEPLIRRSLFNFYYGLAAIRAYQALGEQEKARALLDNLISIIDANPTVTYADVEVHEAAIYALLGQEETAVAFVEEWVNRGGATSLLQQDLWHGLSVLADNPRYQSALRTVNDRLSEQKANLARWEASGEMLPMPKEVADPQ